MVIELPNCGRVDHLGDRGSSKGQQDLEKFYLYQVSLNTPAMCCYESFVHPAIRRYEKNDGVAVLQLSQKYASWDSTPTEADIQGFYSSEPDFFLVAELDRRIVGFVYGRESKSVPDEALRRWKATKVGSVEVLAVEEQYRRRGIATLLLNRLFAVFGERGIDMVTLSVPADEIGAKELYDKLGFETRGYFMRKKL